MSEIDTEQFKKIVKAIRIAEVAGINVTLTPEECAYLYSVFDNLNAEIGQMEAELARRDEKIAELEAIVSSASFRKFLVEQIKDPELAEAYVQACIQDTTYKELLARRNDVITRLKEDAERLANGLDIYWSSIPEGQSAIELHRALMKEIGG